MKYSLLLSFFFSSLLTAAPLYSFIEDYQKNLSTAQKDFLNCFDTNVSESSFGNIVWNLSFSKCNLETIQNKAKKADFSKEPILNLVFSQSLLNAVKLNASNAELVAFTLDHLEKNLLNKEFSLFELEFKKLLFNAYGNTGQLSKAHEFLLKNPALLEKRKDAENILNAVIQWNRPPYFLPLQDWVFEQLKTKKSLDQRLSYLKILWDSELKKQKKLLLKKEVLSELEILWLNNPGIKDIEKIRKFSDEIGVSQLLKAPKISELSAKDLLGYTKGLVAAVESENALKIIRRALHYPSPKRGTEEDSFLWETFLYHIRILRILDRREEIPVVIRSYLVAYQFLNIQLYSKEKLSEFFDRAYQVARLHWNYNDFDEALKVVDLISDLNKTNKTEFSLGNALYVKARIFETRENSKESIRVIDETLAQSTLGSDNRDELQWRKFFLLLDQLYVLETKGNLKSILELADQIRKKMNNDTDKGRWNYWVAQVYKLGKNKEKYQLYLNKAYEADPFSFYSNMAGLENFELNKTPLKKWNLADLSKNSQDQTPLWSHFVSHGKPKKPHLSGFTKAYLFTHYGFFSEAKTTLNEWDAQLWKYALSSKNSLSERADLTRAATWLRRASGDFLGGLRSAEILRQIYGFDLSTKDLTSLYPKDFWQEIQSAANTHKVDPILATSLIRQESAFNPEAKSIANAMGLMQMIPPVAREEAQLLKIKNFTIENLYQPKTATYIGVHHLMRLLKKFNNSWICSLASYNAGSPPVEKWIHLYLPLNPQPLVFIERISFLETKNYVRAILRNYINYARIYGFVDKLELTKLLRMPEELPGSEY